MEWTESARTPGNGPSPTAVTNRSAQTKVRHCARDGDHSPRDQIDAARGGHVLRGAHRQREREDDGDRRSKEGDVQRLEHAGECLWQVLYIWRDRAAQDVGHASNAGNQVLRLDTGDDESLTENCSTDECGAEPREDGAG